MSDEDKDVAVSGMITVTLRLVVRDAKGDMLSRTDVRGGHSHRMVHKGGKKTGQTLQLAWDEYGKTFGTIDCKVCMKNDWKAKSGTDPSTQYDILPTGALMWRITCKNCGSVFDSG